jgi:hypothetical protein
MLDRSLRQDIRRIWSAALGASVAVALLSQCAVAQAPDLQLSAHTLTFADIDPQSTGDNAAQENPISAFVSYSGKGTVHVYMPASGNLNAVGDGPPVPVPDVYWIGTGSGYESGKLSSDRQVEAASGPLVSKPGAGWRFYLKRGAYDSGTYQLSVTVIALAE